VIHMIWYEHTVGPCYTQGRLGRKTSYVTYVEGNIEILTVV